MLIPLHTKSSYSFGIGTASPEALVEHAAAAGLPALALTDLENLYGQVRFHHLCGSRGVRAVTGVELRPGFLDAREPGRRDGRLVLLARDDEGWANLCRIVSRRRVRRDSTSPRATGEDPVASLAGRSGGLFVLSDHAPTCRRVLREGLASREHVALLLVRPGGGVSSEDDLVTASHDLGVPLVADVDAVMLSAEDHALHVLLTAMRLGSDVRTVREQALAEPPERHLGDPAQAAERFPDRPEALEAAARIAGACTLDLRRRPRVLPPVLAGAEHGADEELTRRCRSALESARRRGRFHGGAYDERLENELRVIAELGFASYFLVVAEIVAAAAERRIRTGGRGSAAGSLVCHALGITQIDPLAAGLYFERFLHPRRADPPDIDVDVDSRRRDELLDWVRRRWGRERVAMVSAHQTYRRRSALREGLKALGLSAAAVDLVMRRLPHDIGGEPETDAPEVDDGALEALVPPQYREALPLLRRLEGMPSHLSVHPAGVVLAPGDLDALAPLERAPKGVVVTQYDLRSVEEAGLLKIDLLGARTLAETDETLALLGDGARVIPGDDPATFAALDRAATLGCFQVESPAVRSVLRSVPIRSLDDLTAALAVVRPGAAAGHAKRAWVRRARGEEPPEYLHPALQPRLAATHGVPLYEEDIIFLLHAVGGLTVAEADELRAAIVDAGEDRAQLSRLGERFVRRAVGAGTERDVARAAWRAAERFAAYSFSKAHAASHALLAYRAVFLRTHHPVEYGCAVLNDHGGMYPLRAVAAEVARWGVPLAAPSVTCSELHAGVERGAGIRLGLAAVKRLRRSSAQAIVEARTRRPFGDLTDLLRRVRLARAEVRALVLCGACDELAPLSPEGHPLVHQAVLERLDGRADEGALAAACARLALLPREGPEGERAARWRRLVRIRQELEHLDMHPSGHPLAVLRPDAEAAGCLPVTVVPEREGQVVRVAAVLAASRRVRTGTGEVMQFLTLEDEHGTIEAVLFPPAYRRAGRRVTTPGPYLVTGRCAVQEGDAHLVVTDLRPFHEREQRAP